MKIKIIQNIKAIILGLIVTLGMGYVAAATFVGPGCAPPGCNADVPINASSSPQIKTGSLTVGGLGIVGNFTFLPSAGAAVTDGSVLTSDENGKASWSTPFDGAAALAAMLSTLQFKSLISYGEAHTTGLGSDVSRIIENGQLTQGTKYAYVLVTSGGIYPSVKTLNSSSALLGVDAGRSIKIACGNGGSFTASPTASFRILNRDGADHTTWSATGAAVVSYQGTFVYDPTSWPSTAAAWNTWDSIPTTPARGLTIVPNHYNGCTDARGYYSVYIFNYNTIKTYMDMLYQATGAAKYKFNDPLSSNTDLHNGSVWTN